MRGFVKGNIKWTVMPEADAASTSDVCLGLGVSPAMGRLLCRRGCRNADEARAFLRMENASLHDPFLLPDMDCAVERIRRAVSERERILIFGDYDADGVTSVSVLYLYLSELGADVGFYVPKRSEGYGMTVDAVKKIAEDGARLIITVDCGTTAIEEVKTARQLGVDVVVTDHHKCTTELPDAAAVVNPKREDSRYPFSGLAGVGVAYKLVCALESRIRCGGDTEKATLSVSGRYIDLVAIGTVTDVMPMTDENRVIVSFGLSRISEMSRPGVAALMEASMSDGTREPKKRPRVTSGYIGYTLGPRINAAGRMSDASLAVRLFTTDNREAAAALARELCCLNLERQRLEAKTTSEACAMISECPDISQDSVIVLAGDDWHHGVIGIVASHITEKYSKPSIIITFEGGGGGEHDVGKGSGRSVSGLDLSRAFGACSEHLLKFGGHELAGGISLERGQLDGFRRAINEYARGIMEKCAPEPEITVDDVLGADEITLGLADELLKLEPFGEGNGEPLFMTEGVRIISAVGVGEDKHTRLTVCTDDGGGLCAMCFSVTAKELSASSGDIVDLLYNLDVNEFRGTRSVRLLVRGLRINAEREAELYESLRSGQAVRKTGYEAFVPTRQDLASLYRTVVEMIRTGEKSHTLGDAAAAAGICRIKVRLALDIFSELGILMPRLDGETFEAALPPEKMHVDLDDSELLTMLRRKYL